MIKKISSSYIKIFLIFSYIICWLSISTSFDDIILIFKMQNTTINNKLNFIRQFLNILIFPILITIFLSRLKEISFKRNLIFFLSFFYFIFQIPGLFLYDNSYKNLVYITSSLNIIFIFTIAALHFNKKEYLNFIKIALLMLILVTSINYNVFINFFSSKLDNFYLFIDKDFFLGKIGPRSTGASRSWLLIFIISNFIFIKFFLKHSKIKISFYIFCATIILLFQSRTIVFILMMFILLNFYYERKFNKINFFKYFFYYIGCPLLMLVLILILKSTILNKTNLNKTNLNKTNIQSFIENHNPKIIVNDYKRPIDYQTFSSGRVEDWKSIINLTNTSLIFGFGSQADRFLINQSASNGLLYALSSSGILGLFFYVILSIYCFWIAVIKLYINFLKTFNYKDYYGSIVILIILARSILESSYAVFSIDFIIFYTFINYLYRYSVVNNDGIK